MKLGQDVEELEKLIRDFGTPSLRDRILVPGNTVIQETVQVIVERYNMLTEEMFNLVLQTLDIQKQVPIIGSTASDTFKRIASIEWIRQLHSYLYQDILTIAGEFRRVTDTGGGVVVFGGYDEHGQYGRYKGSHPNDIHRDLQYACDSIHKTELNSDPLTIAVMFYQRFVYCHPFYDANGRIGRLILTVLLASHRISIQWKSMEGKQPDIANHRKKKSIAGGGKFLGKLNEVHDCYPAVISNTPGIDKYYERLGYLVSHVKKYCKFDAISPARPDGH